MGFARKVLATFYNPSFYKKEIADTTLGSSIKTLVVLEGLMSILVLGVLFFALAPWRAPAFLNTVQSMYPRDLVITLAHGEVSINQPEPYVVPNPFAQGSDMPRNAVVFDTKTPFAPKDIDMHSTFVLVKKDFFVTTDANGPRINQFADSQKEGTTTIDRAEVDAFFARVHPYVLPVVWMGGIIVIAFGSVLVTGFLTIGYLLYALILALFVWVIGSIREVHLTYAQAYKVSLYAMIPVILLSGIMLLLQIPRPLFFFTFMTLFIAFVNIQKDPDELERVTS